MICHKTKPTTFRQGVSRSNGNEKVITFPRAPASELHYQKQIIIIPRTLLFLLGRFYPLPPSGNAVAVVPSPSKRQNKLRELSSSKLYISLLMRRSQHFLGLEGVVEVIFKPPSTYSSNSSTVKKRRLFEVDFNVAGTKSSEKGNW